MSTTIDITDLVESSKDTFIKWAVAYIYGQELLIPELGAIVALPILKDIDQEIVKVIVTALVNSAVMEAFFLNTVLKKASQAGDYVAAVAAVKNLPTTATVQEFRDAASAEIKAFSNFVVLTS